MSKTKAQPMATKHDEITLILQQAGEDDIEIIHRSGETVIHIKTVSEPQPAEPKGGSDNHRNENLRVTAQVPPGKTA
jgi:hypothetical protein